MEKILIVEDSLLQGRMLQDLLIENDFHTDLAENGETALEKLDSQDFDLILMDMVLPDFSGIHLLKKIRALPDTSNIPIIVLSGLTDKENVIESLEMGIHDYITKPFHNKELINRINIHLRLRKAHLKLIEANSSNDKFLSILGHDLKNAFSSLYGSIDLIDRFIDDAEQRTKIIGIAKNTASDVNDLLDKLLLWGRMLNQGVRQNNTIIDLNQTTTQLLNKIADSIKGKKLDLQIQVDGEAIIEADINMVETSLRNILTNAIKFTKEGGLIKISSKSIEQGGINYHCVVVEDNGIGITKKSLLGLFDSAYQQVEKDTEGNMGVGLGLSIVSEMVRQCEGKLFVESQIGVGSTFTIGLPAKDIYHKSSKAFSTSMGDS